MITNTVTKLIIYIAFLTIPVSLFASTIETCDGTVNRPCIVQDTFDNSADTRHFRTSRMLAEAYKGNITGLDKLWLSASGMPSESGFAQIFRQIKLMANPNVTQIIDLDLREEDHAFLNHDAITLTTQYDWINKGKSHQESVTSERQWINQLHTETVINDILSSAQFKSGQFNDGIDETVESVKSERVAVEKLGLTYRRLTISDHMAPAASEVDRFIELIDKTKNTSWYHIHCRAGNGRTTTFMAMLDMLFNAKEVSFDEIIKRQASVDPFYDLSVIDRGDPALSQFYYERYLFLQKFYQFALARHDGYTGKWTDWIATK